jgi:predicted  nucleic acid-binding Zn-ribbon protein
MFDDSVQVRCRRCKGVFRERARRLQSGYSRQCPTCEVVLFFDEDSQEQNIRRAMRAARQVRAALREAEMEHPRRKRVVRGGRGSYRQASEAHEAETDEG